MKLERVAASEFVKGDLAITKSGDGVLVVTDGASEIWDGVKPRRANRNITFVKVDMRVPTHAKTAKQMMSDYLKYVKKNGEAPRRTRRVRVVVPQQ